MHWVEDVAARCAVNAWYIVRVNGQRAGYLVVPAWVVRGQQA
jgi:hypothetical protein